ncbi:hypothetical protein, partial [Streptomyces sp. CA-278952]|uniref:hypothetical protein n=2 Tax=Streptomyces sp. CA-278952 TaxID=2980556 RepID=UPI002368783C
VRVYTNDMAAEPALSGPEVHGEASESVLIKDVINVLIRVKKLRVLNPDQNDGIKTLIFLRG